MRGHGRPDRVRRRYGSSSGRRILTSRSTAAWKWSIGAHSDPGILTWSHYMRFPIPTASLADALQSQKVLVSVGSLAEYLEPEQLEALRDLLSRVGAFSPSAAPEKGPKRRLNFESACE